MLAHNCKDNPLLEGLISKFRCDILLPTSMVDLFDRDTSDPIMANDQRRFKRWRFVSYGALECRQTLEALKRSPSWHRIYTKDISRGGLAFLHSEQLYPLEQMRILLPTKTIEPICQHSQQSIIEVKRCRRCGDRCYEIGGVFADQFRDDSC